MTIDDLSDIDNTMKYTVTSNYFRIPVLHSSAASSSSQVVTAFKQKTARAFPPRSPCSPDLAPSDFHLFLNMKELENAVTTWLKELAAEEYDIGILKLVHRYDRCLNVGGDYVEK
ncbi:hypothetical protein AVEN_197178-1 [Araneus ventricosus]|uniref:Uncharacterized protein n=1 Tax=Araneus ventricosus TaxID=182803 RepID=A0A4Y2Q3R7_ARAVE|nr:hypothetical protein AVEN_197178-1 [Araneus ventricosus]